MTITPVTAVTGGGASGARAADLKLEVVVLPVADVDRADYGSYASFRDPDGNGWSLHEIKVRLPGRLSATARYDDAREPAGAWYAEYMVRERPREELPV
jgi:hypothetical protein